MSNIKDKKTIFRSAETGQFVTEKYDQKHPKTTEREGVDIGKAKKVKK